MNQQKTGEFLKHLRKQKGMTQEQWQNGSLSPPAPYQGGKQAAICQIWTFSLSLRTSMM